MKHGDYEYPITLQLIKDGRKNRVLNKPIFQNLDVIMVHGSKDKSVPVKYSRKILHIFKNAKKKLVIINKGDHSLSSPKWLSRLKKELKLIDTTLRMFVEPVLRLDLQLLEEHLTVTRQRKEHLLTQARAERDDLMSNPKFPRSAPVLAM